MKNAFVVLMLLTLACNPPKNCIEKIRTECSCMQLYDPVCGCNNKTYGNACMAECASITSYKKGECPQKDAGKIEGITWQLTKFSVPPTPQDVPENVKITMKLNNGTLGGNGGCNTMGGSYKLEGSNLTFSGIFSTKMYCEHASKFETMFFQMLEKCQSFSINNGMLELNCNELGILIFKKG